MISQPKTVNDTGCLQKHLLTVIETQSAAVAQKCFKALPSPLNCTSSGYLECFSVSLSQQNGYKKSLGGALLKAWKLAFSSADVSSGGCPNIKTGGSIA